MPSSPEGLEHLSGYLDEEAQCALVAALRPVLAAAPFYTPTMPRTGRPMSVHMTNCGTLGWMSDKAGGYRYQATHPETGAAWPPMPSVLLDIWREVTAYPAAPEACLINYYGTKARMGLHRDEDEEDFAAPVLSISLGDTALFRVGGAKRRDPTTTFALESGDVVVLGGAARLAYHGVDRIRPGTSDLLSDDFPGGGRLNLTLRRVHPPR